MTVAVLSFASTWGTAAEGALVNGKLVSMGFIEKLKRAMNGEKPWAARLAGQPDFVIEATTTGNENGKVGDLDLKGFQPKTGLLYFIKLRHWAQAGASDNQRYYCEYDYAVMGSDTAATDPILCSVGGIPVAGGLDGNLVRAFGLLGGAAQAYGMVHTELTAASTQSTTKNSPGFTITASPDGLDDATVPAHRLAKAIGSNIYDVDGTVSTEATTVNVDPDAAGTNLLKTVGAATPALVGPASSAKVSITYELHPPATPFLAVDGTLDPGTIDVHVIVSENDAFRHRIEVFVSDPIAVPFEGT